MVRTSGRNEDGSSENGCRLGHVQSRRSNQEALCSWEIISLPRGVELMREFKTNDRVGLFIVWMRVHDVPSC